MLNSKKNAIESIDPFADFDTLEVKEVRLRPTAEEKKLRTNDEKASFISIIIIVTA